MHNNNFIIELLLCENDLTFKYIKLTQKINNIIK